MYQLNARVLSAGEEVTGEVHKHGKPHVHLVLAKGLPECRKHVHDIIRSDQRAACDFCLNAESLVSIMKKT